MRKFMIFAIAALAYAVPAAAQEAPAQAAPAPSAEDQANVDRGGIIFSAFSQAVRSDQISTGEKSALFGCMYDNSLKAISEETAKVLAANPQLDAKKPETVFSVAAVVCGARSAKPTDPAVAAPTPQTAKPESR